MVYFKKKKTFEKVYSDLNTNNYLYIYFLNIDNINNINHIKKQQQTNKQSINIQECS